MGTVERLRCPAISHILFAIIFGLLTGCKDIQNTDPTPNRLASSESFEAEWIYDATISGEELLSFGDLSKGWGGNRVECLLRLTFKLSGSYSKIRIAVNGIRAINEAFHLSPQRSWSEADGTKTIELNLTDLRFEANASIFKKLKKIHRRKGTLQIRVIGTFGIASAKLLFVKSSKVEPSENKPTVVLDAVVPPETPTNSRTIQFRFHSSGPEYPLQCAFDKSAFTPCSSPMAYSNLSNGSHKFEVRAISSGGRAGETLGHHFQVVGSNPKIRIDSVTPAQSPTKSSTLTVSFSRIKHEDKKDSEKGKQKGKVKTLKMRKAFCQLDGGGYTRCSSPITYQGIGEGSHKVEILWNHGKGKFLSPASYSWVVDLTPPQLEWGRIPASLTNQSSEELSFRANEPASFECSVDGSAYGTCESPLMLSNLAEATHTVSVIASDLVGNRSLALTHSWTIDQTPPRVIRTGLNPEQNPSANSTLTYSFATSEPATTSCFLDDAPIACVSPLQINNLSEGTHTLLIAAKDLAGNESPVHSYTWVVDLTRPYLTLTLVSPRSLPTSSSTAIFEFFSSEDSFYECRLDGQLVSPCGSPMAFSNLSEGQHNFSLIATDRAGNVSELSSLTWGIDQTPPQLTITSVVPPENQTNVDSLELYFETSEPGIIRCNFDQGGDAPCSSPFVVTALVGGQHTLVLSAEDRAGNLSSRVTYTWEVITLAPKATIDRVIPAASVTSSSSIMIEFSSAQTSRFSCSLDGHAFSFCSSGISYTNLADGNHTFEVRVQKRDGSLGDGDFYSWTVDTTPPTVMITSTDPAWSPTAKTEITVNFVANETASFYCAQDGGAAFSCTPAQTLHSLMDGTHKFVVFAEDSVGNRGATVSYSWTVDTTPILTSDVTVSQITQFSALITWRTNLRSTTQVFYGVGSLSDQTLVDNQLVTSHSVLLTGLKRFSFYSFQTKSVDRDGRAFMSELLNFRTSR